MHMVPPKFWSTPSEPGVFWVTGTDTSCRAVPAVHHGTASRPVLLLPGATAVTVCPPT